MIIVPQNIHWTLGQVPPIAPKAIGNENIIPMMMPCSHHAHFNALIPIPKPSKVRDRMIVTTIAQDKVPDELAISQQINPQISPRMVEMIILFAIKYLRLI